MGCFLEKRSLSNFHLEKNDLHTFSGPGRTNSNSKTCNLRLFLSKIKKILKFQLPFFFAKISFMGQLVDYMKRYPKTFWKISHFFTTCKENKTIKPCFPNLNTGFSVQPKLYLKKNLNFVRHAMKPFRRLSQGHFSNPLKRWKLIFQKPNL